MRFARLAIALLFSVVCAAAASAQDAPPPAETAAKPPAIELANAPADEAEALNRLSNAKSWPLRAFAVMRLERFDCEASAGRLLAMAGDNSWRVRSFAFACLARRGVAVPEDRLAAELDPRVLRTILRGRYTLPQKSIDARIERCEESMNLIEATYALECLAALEKYDDKAIRERMDTLLDRIIFRMDRPQGGVLSPRLAAITGGPDSGRDYRWREWANKNKKKPGYEPAALVPVAPSSTAPGGARLVERNKIAALDSERFVALERYIASVGDRPMDLAILIDCTASMSKEIADAQSGLDDLVDFLGSVTKGVRIGLVGYRDRGDKWETRAWDFSSSLDEVRKNLWSLSAEGGGDEPESVLAAMKIALTKFAWLPNPGSGTNAAEPIRACVIVGDAPPHVGEGTACVDLAKRAFAKGVRFYGIVARDREANLKPEDEEGAPPKPTKPPEDPPAKAPKDRRPGQVEPPRAPPPTMRKRPSHTWFPEIAEAGGGRAEILKDRDSLVAEIAELTVADRYREEFADFFEAFRLLCR
jgi:hypothetical protein